MVLYEINWNFFKRANIFVHPLQIKVNSTHLKKKFHPHAQKAFSSNYFSEIRIKVFIFINLSKQNHKIKQSSPNGLHRVHYFLSLVTTHTRFTYHLLWKVHNLISTMYTYIVFLYYTSTIMFTFSTTHTMYKLKCALGYLPTHQRFKSKGTKSTNVLSQCILYIIVENV